MPSLLDIAPVGETVRVGDQEIPVYGISVAGVAVLLGRFPDLGRLMTGRVEDLDAGALLRDFGPAIVAAVIAAGTGDPGNEKAEAVASRLGIETQLDFLDKILRLTMPNGVDPFVARLERYMAILDSPLPGEAPARGGGRSGKDRASKSRKRSKP